MTGWTLDQVRAHCESLTFVSGLGLRVVAATPDCARLAYAPRASDLRPEGVVAGPVLFALADMAFYALVLAATGRVGALTTHLSLEFLRPCVGACVGVAEPLRVGRRRVVGSVAIVSDATGETVAHATGAYSLPPPGVA